MAKACQGLFYFVFPGFPVCVFIFFIFKDSAQCLCFGSAQMNSSSVSSCICTGLVWILLFYFICIDLASIIGFRIVLNIPLLRLSCFNPWRFLGTWSLGLVNPHDIGDVPDLVYNVLN